MKTQEEMVKEIIRKPLYYYSLFLPLLTKENSVFTDLVCVLWGGGIQVAGREKQSWRSKKWGDYMEKS
jgi:hypothetical protein